MLGMSVRTIHPAPNVVPAAGLSVDRSRPTPLRHPFSDPAYHAKIHLNRSPEAVIREFQPER